MQTRAAISPPFTATAARESDRLSRAVMRHVEVERRARELATLRGQIDEIRTEIYVVERDPNARPGHLGALRGVLRRAQALYAACSEVQ
jgi:hypothetical protein